MPDLEALFTPLRDASVAPEPMELLQRRSHRLRRRRMAIRGGLLLGVSGLLVALAAMAGGDRADRVDVTGRGVAPSETTASTPVPRSAVGNHPGTSEPSVHGLPGLLAQGASGTVRAQAGSSCWQKGRTGVCVDAIAPAGGRIPTLNVHRGEQVALRFDRSGTESVQASEYAGGQQLRVDPGEPAHLHANLAVGVHDVIVHARFRQGTVSWYVRLRIT